MGFTGWGNLNLVLGKFVFSMLIRVNFMDLGLWGIETVQPALPPPSLDRDLFHEVVLKKNLNYWGL